VLEWRNQLLPSFEPSHNIALGSAETVATARKRSALAALREFFTLSPAWMRAATAAAVIAICALVAFTVTHFYEQPRTVVKVVPTGPTQDEVDAMVKKRAEELRLKEQQEEKERQAALASATEQRVVTSTDNGAAATLPKVRKAAGASSASTVAAGQQRQESPEKAKASREARQQLAELVQVSREDDSLPRLSDLIDDSNDNQ
ncbi:MAG: replication termination factor 2 family protein, partial [Acidobacteria bacterium]|nr:replication termination factor 2 family protein [Acidobacteriota bacterium]